MPETHRTPKTFTATLEQLLRPPGAGEPPAPAPGSTGLALLLASAGWTLYGAVGGLFQGGDQVLVSALKLPLIATTTLLLCLPSLWIFVALAGVTLEPSTLLGAVAGFSATNALVLAGLLPVSWIFSVSSRSLAFVVVLHFAAWLLAVLLARRVLVRVTGGRARVALRLWTILFLFVSLQVATYLQPVLVRSADEPLFRRPRQLFVDHLGSAWRYVLPATPIDEAPGDAESTGRRRP
jgi:hypothetical protein